ncbi:MAG TPA: T9SS type A sorting domain-containing protein [Flavisolibacter sp.]|nr:T9SS type A sorting domain-containing protein [Flavisolibacter sp.]
MYEGRQDIVTDLRVHSIASIYDAFDYNSEANGMKYSNNLNTTAVTINGAKDNVNTGDINWELASGTQGALVILHRRNTTFSSAEASFTSYYDDNKSKPASNCTGDGQAWGTSGVGIVFKNTALCTDPLSTDCGVGTKNYRTLVARRTVYFEAPAITNDVAVRYNNQLNNPLTVSATASPVSNISTASAIQENMVTANSLNKVLLIPNPAKGSSNIIFQSTGNSRAHISIIDALGKTVQQRILDTYEGLNSYKFELNGLRSGLYYIRILDAGKQTVSKLIIQ